MQSDGRVSHMPRNLRFRIDPVLPVDAQLEGLHESGRTASAHTRGVASWLRLLQASQPLLERAFGCLTSGRGRLELPMSACDTGAVLNRGDDGFAALKRCKGRGRRSNTVPSPSP